MNLEERIGGTSGALRRGMDIRRQRPQPADASTKEVSLSLIRESDRLRLRQPSYPRIEELAAQIKEHGQTTPMFVRLLHGGLYELISGYRRRAALEKLGISTALVRVFDVDETEAYSLAICRRKKVPCRRKKVPKHVAR
jgi:ParB family chromosome partitioning protein